MDFAMKRFLLASGALAVVAASPALSFNFNFASGTPAQAQAAFITAGNQWSALFNDPITINYNVGTVNSPGGFLAAAGSNSQVISYTNVRNAMIADATSAADIQANSTLAAGTTFSAQSNYFSDIGGSATLGTVNLQLMDINRATAKALGLRPANDPGLDATLTMNIAYSFDYNPNDGIAAGSYDFVGIAAHEIGHALGFVSGVDYVDGLAAGSNTSTQFAWASNLDLFRFSGAGVRNLAAGNAAKYFSIDGGLTTNTILFSNGVSRGDGRQASHWKDGLGIGIMDPTAGQGELLAITANDITAMDVIGFNRTAVPEPFSMVAMGAGLLVLARRRRKN